MLKRSHYTRPVGDLSYLDNSCSLLEHLHVCFQVPEKDKSNIRYIVKALGIVKKLDIVKEISLLLAKSLFLFHDILLPKHDKRFCI